MFEDLSFGVPPLPSTERQPESASEWVEHIRELDMPAFGATVAAVRNVTGDERASAGRLAQVILQDAALTTKVLKLSNSAFYNPTRQSISTISKAIVVLGFDLVADIALGVCLVDAMLAGGVRGRVTQEMARCFHAAVQARAIAHMRKDPRAEEVFIATLLARVGDMAFWCFGGEAAERLDQALSRSAAQQPARTPEEVQMAELGFRLHQLSVGLAREWHLGPLLTGVLESRGRPGPAERSAILGQKIALAAEKGWDSQEMAGVLAELKDYVGIAPEALLPLLAAEAEQAARIVTFYGAPEAARQIPLPVTAQPLLEAEAPAAPVGPDPQLQLRILRELSSLMGSGGGLNEIVQLALEGMLRGVGLGRVLFALVTSKRQQVVGKSALGAGAESLVQHFVFTLGGAPDDLFNSLAAQPRALLFTPDNHPRGVRATRLWAVTGEHPACIAPIQVQGRLVGLFYADTGRSGGSLDREAFETFCLFAQQVSFAFAASSSRRA